MRWAIKLTKATSIPKGYADGSTKMGGKMDSKAKM